MLQPRKNKMLYRPHLPSFPLLPPPSPSFPLLPPPLTTTSLKRALSSVPKMTVVEMFGCNLNNNLSPLQVDAVYSKSGLASIYQGCEVKGFRYRRIRNGCLYLQQCLLFVICFIHVLECFDLQNCALIRLYNIDISLYIVKFRVSVYKNIDNCLVQCKLTRACSFSRSYDKCVIVCKL